MSFVNKSAIALLIANVSAAAIADGQVIFDSTMTMEGILGAPDTVIPGLLSTFIFADGVLSGTQCTVLEGSCPPPAGFSTEMSAKICVDLSGTYSKDGTALANPDDSKYTEDSTKSNFYYSMEQMGTLTYFHGTVDTTANTIENWKGSMTVTSPMGDVTVQFTTTAKLSPCQGKGETGGLCMDDRSCNDATSCCGTGTYWKATEEPEEGEEKEEGEAKEETAEEKAEREEAEEDFKTHEGVCGDGKIQDGGYTRGLGIYSHVCSASKLIASAGSILAASYLI